MNQHVPSRSELYLRFTRRSMWTILLIILSLGIMGLGMTIWPEGAVSHLIARAPWLFPMTIIFATIGLQTSMRKHRFTPDSPEVSAVMNDELRRASLDRARTVAFLVVLIAQFPIALCFSRTAMGLGLGVDLPAFRAVMAMAITTITLGMTVFIISFLVFDRE